MIFEKEINKENSHIHFKLVVNESTMSVVPLAYILNNKNFGTNINELVYYIRTIFRNYSEEILIVEIENTKCRKQVKLIKKDVEKYKYKEKLEDATINFTYSPKGINFNIDNESYENNIDENASNILKECFKAINTLNNNKNININVFSKEQQILVEIYRLFFNESPDFSQKEDINKAQSMMWLLYKEGINLEDEDGFTIRHTGKPWSFNIETIIDGLIPYGKINDTFDSIKFKKESYNTIISMGQIIRRYIEKSKDQNLMLENISKISYIIDRCIPRIYETEDIMNTGYVDCNIDEIFDICTFLSALETSLLDEQPVEKYNNITEEQKQLKLSIK